MEIKILWTKFAEEELQHIFEFYKDKAGFAVAKKLVSGIFDESLILRSQPEIGQIEAHLKDRAFDYRYLIYKKKFKIIYRMLHAKNRIEIIDVFDVRQYPIHLKRTK